MDDPECAFCRIVGQQEEATVVFEDAACIAFFPRHPASVGHTLVVPKVHVRDFLELDERTGSGLVNATVHVGRAIREALNPEGMNAITSAGSAATQTVFHLHVHLVPRWEGDKIGRIWPPAQPWIEAMEGEVAQLVRAACGGSLS